MFENLSNRLSRALRNIRGRGRLTNDNIKDTLREVRISLLEADVALPVVEDFIRKVKENSLGKEVNESMTPGQEFIKIMRAEIISMLGKENNHLNLATSPPAVILISGVQGCGKTTSIGKLGKYLNKKHKKTVLVVSTDVYRPAAIKQLEILSQSAGVDFFPSDENQKPIDIVNHALDYAKLNFYDSLLIDTAGRMHADAAMMDEIIKIHTTVNPIETLLVVDAMTGQDAANTARHFSKALPLTGIILTKVDSDARGGAALSICYITGNPIKFMGLGENIDALEPFYPNRLADRILGMGDIVSLIEDIDNNINLKSSQKITKKLTKNEAFDFNDLLEQIKQMRDIGGMTSIINKLPGMLRVPNDDKLQINDNILVRMEAIINSMTKVERLNPNIIKGSRKRRIAIGSGMQVHDVNCLLQQFDQMQRMMKKIKKSGISRIMRKIKSY